MTVLIDQSHVRKANRVPFNGQLPRAGAGDDTKSIGLPGERCNSSRSDDRQQGKKAARHHAAVSSRIAEGKPMRKFSTRINAPNTVSAAPIEATRS